LTQRKKIQSFIRRSVIFLSIIFISIYIIFLQADGYSDDFYIKFTTPKQSSLILGTSRAAQGIQPNVLHDILSKNIFNYAFTASSSPYGPTYFNSIKKKLAPIKNGTFILTVDPWSISSTAKNPNNIKEFRELKGVLAKTSVVDAKPNFEYLFYSFNHNYASIFKKDSSMFLHNDGWLEVSVNMEPKNVKRRTKKKINDYLDIVNDYHYSEIRHQYLDKTIDYLKQYGNVYLIRLPIDPEMMVIENKLLPNFDEKISLTKAKCNGYLDLTPLNSEYTYTDGNHIYKESGKLVSKKIALWIRDIETEKLKN
jgi:hypothetical protein